MYYGFLGLAITGLISCQSELEEGQDNEQALRTSQIESLGFNTEEMYNATMDGKSGIVVEGDIFLDDSMISDLLGNDKANQGEIQQKYYVTPNLLPKNRDVTIDIYLDSSYGSNMIAAFNELNLNVSFRRTFRERGSDIAILSRNIPNTPRGGTVLRRSAGFPRNSRPATPITLNSRIFDGTNMPAGTPTVIAHEIGHAIGFRPTDFADRSFSCGGDFDAEGRSDALFVPGTPRSAEAGSWMLACSNGSDRPFTRSDRTLIQFVY